MAATVSELLSLQQLLSSIDVSTGDPMKLYYNNQVTLLIAANLVFHEHTNHIKINCHFIREHI